MKIKLLITLLLICVIGLCSCSAKTNNNSNKSISSTSTEDKSTNENNNANGNTTVNNIAEETEDTDSNFTDTTIQSLDDVENYLKDAGVLTGEKTEMAAAMVGAVNGFKYLDSSVEVYEFDIESEAYKKLLETNEMDLSDLGMTIPVNAINGKYVLYCDESDTKEDIIKVFNEMK